MKQAKIITACFVISICSCNDKGSEQKAIITTKTVDSVNAVSPMHNSPNV